MAQPQPPAPPVAEHPGGRVVADRDVVQAAAHLRGPADLALVDELDAEVEKANASATK